MAGTSAAATSYRLVATDDDKLKGHVGHKVEIMGTLESAAAPGSTTSPTGTTGTTSGTTGSTSTGSTTSGTTSGTSTTSPSYSGPTSASAMQSLKVTSVRMVSATCP
jgi:hypothetical protein